MLKWFVLTVILLFLPGCGPQTESAARAESAHPDHAAHDAGLALELDQGRRWEVDEHTRGSAEKMISLVQETEPIGSVDDARALGESLSAELDVLIEGCTMTGPAHDQLHVILAALFPRVGELKNGMDVEQLDATRLELLSVFEAYEQHFD